MKWIYILVAIVIVASISGCADRKKAETPVPVQTTDKPGGSAVTPAATIATTPSATPQAEVDDIFNTESDLTSIDTTFNDMNMEISLLENI